MRVHDGCFRSALALLARCAPCILAALAFAAAASSQPIELVADLDPSQHPGGSDSQGWVEAGGLVYFPRLEEDAYQLWRSDGSASGTWLLREWPIRAFSADLRGAELSDGRLLFSMFGAADLGVGEELWISDGTPEGTLLYADLCPGPCHGEPAPRGAVPPSGLGFHRLANEVLFVARPDGENRLFATDGGAAGPRLASELQVVAFAVDPQGVLLVSAPPAPDGPIELWSSSGLPGSENSLGVLPHGVVRAFAPHADGALLLASQDFSSPLHLYRVRRSGIEQLASYASSFELRSFAVAGSLAFLRLVDSSGCRLHRTDGTPSGTFEIAMPPGPAGFPPCVDDTAALGERLVFAQATAAEGLEPWITDGSAAGTFRLVDHLPGPESGRPNRLTTVGGQVFWFADDPGGPALWTTDGSTSGTRRVRGFDSVGADHFRRPPLGALADRAVFPAEEDGSGLEPWISDGTSDGTEQISDLSPDRASSRPLPLSVEIGSVVAASREPDGGPELFRAFGDHTIFPLADLDGGALTGASIGGQVLTRVVEGDALFGPTSVRAVDLESGDQETLLVGSLFAAAVELDQSALVVTQRALSSSIRALESVWSTDGTVPGTRLLLDALQGQANIVLAPRAPLVVDGVGYFTYFTEAFGAEIWRSDGTVEGTRLFVDLQPGPNGSLPLTRSATADRLFVTATIDEDHHLVAIDLADGTLDVVSVTETPGLQNGFGPVAGLRGRLLWFDVSSVGEIELWSSDATLEGTQRLAAFEAARGPFTTARGLAYFAAATPQGGYEPWRTDGTPEGTFALGDLTTGPEGSGPEGMTAIDGVVLFAAATPETGQELWRSDGTPEGTVPLEEIVPGAAGSRPQRPAISDDAVLLSAWRPDVGRELFGLDRAALQRPCAATDHTLCLGDDRFLVEAEWLDRATGRRARANAVPFREDTGLFWFFEPDNVELVVKVLDGTAMNDHHWVFYGALSDVTYWVTVVDTLTGSTRTYTNDQGELCGIGDTRALPSAATFGLDAPPSQLSTLATTARPEIRSGGSANTAPCDPDAQLCLQGGRFAVDVEWTSSIGPVPDGDGVPIPGTDDSGYFWFFDPENVELAIKVLDGRHINERWWVYFGALSDVGYTLRVTDTATGEVRTYQNPEGTLCGQADVDAFAEP
ncbi:MAG: hypothetical protein DWQ36_06500 [Acidobacteria bacterium]|nr:MAG: hypothetical protein DWQ36_06500 [Acidobacteriota bacterium]